MCCVRQCGCLHALLWMCMCIVVSRRAAEAGEYIYLPANPLEVNAKTILTLVAETASWNEASEICRKKYSQGGGTLAKVDSADVAQALKSLRSDRNSNNQNIWFGLHWKVALAKPKLSWSDMSCTDFDVNGYSEFDEGDDEYNQQKPCYAINRQTGEWFQDSCDKRYYFLCQYMDFSDSNCATNNISPFITVSATFYLVPRNDSNEKECTADCSSTVGCFLAWSGTNMCLMGVMEKSGSTFIKSRCIKLTADGSDVDTKTNNQATPALCVAIDTSIIPGVKATAISGYTPLSGVCVNKTSRPSSNASTGIVADAARILTTTITSVQIVTTTDVRTQTTICASDTTMTAVPPYAAIGTVNLPTVGGYLTHPSCPILSTTVNYPCSSQTVTMETISYVTLTTTEHAVTSCHTPNLMSEEQDSSDQFKSPTVDPGGLNELDLPVYEQPIATKAILPNTWPATVTTSTTECIPTTTIASLIVATVTRTLTPTAETTVVTSVVDCTPSSNIFRFDTMQEHLPATPIRATITGSQVPDIVTSSAECVTKTFTQIVETANSKPDVPCACQGKHVNETARTKDDTFISGLIVGTSNLSSRRRMKESAPDDRITAKVPGIFAVAFLLGVFGLLALLDLPVIVGHLRSKVRKQAVV